MYLYIVQHFYKIFRDILDKICRYCKLYGSFEYKSRFFQLLPACVYKINQTITKFQAYFKHMTPLKCRKTERDQSKQKKNKKYHH